MTLEANRERPFSIYYIGDNGAAKPIRATDSSSACVKGGANLQPHSKLIEYYVYTSE